MKHVIKLEAFKAIKIQFAVFWKH